MAESKPVKIKAFCSGGIPGFDFILKLLQEREKCTQVEKNSEKNLTKLINLIQDLKYCNKVCNEFIEFYPLWDIERRECIENIQTIAGKIDLWHRNANVAQIPAAGLGILSGALVITGLALTPVTFGASLGLTIAGTAVGVASATTGAGASVSDMAVTRKKVKEAHECFEQHKKNTIKIIEMIAKITRLADEIEELYDEEMVGYLETILTQSSGSLAKATAFGVVSNVKSVFNLIYSIPEAVAGLKHLYLVIMASPVLQSVFSALVPAQLGTAIAGISAEGAKMGVKIGGQTLVAFSYIGVALGMAVSTGLAAYTIYDMVKKENKTEAANKLRELCEQLEKEHIEIEKLYCILTNAIEDPTVEQDTTVHKNEENYPHTSQ